MYILYSPLSSVFSILEWLIEEYRLFPQVMYFDFYLTDQLLQHVTRAGASIFHIITGENFLLPFFLYWDHDALGLPSLLNLKWKNFINQMSKLSIHVVTIFYLFGLAPPERWRPVQLHWLHCLKAGSGCTNPLSSLIIVRIRALI